MAKEQQAKAKTGGGGPKPASKSKDKAGKSKAQPKRPLLAKKPVDTGRKQEAPRNVAQRFVAYLKNVRLELKKVIWPKRPEVVASTVIVLATLIALAAYVMALDYVSELLVNLVSGVTGAPVLR